MTIITLRLEAWHARSWRCYMCWSRVKYCRNKPSSAVVQARDSRFKLSTMTRNCPSKVTEQILSLLPKRGSTESRAIAASLSHCCLAAEVCLHSSLLTPQRNTLRTTAWLIASFYSRCLATLNPAALLFTNTQYTAPAKQRWMPFSVIHTPSPTGSKDWHSAKP